MENGKQAYRLRQLDPVFFIGGNDVIYIHLIVSFNTSFNVILSVCEYVLWLFRPGHEQNYSTLPAASGRQQ